jgi:hypothetical protein
MVRTLPSGVISLDTAVERIARTARNGNLYPTILYRDEADAAWRKLCALPEDHVRPLMLTAEGFIQKVDRTQFFGFADKYWKFASVLRYPPNGEGVPQEVNEHCPSHDLLDESGRLHRGARLVFRESEINAALGEASEPTGDNPAPGKPTFDEVREPDKKPFPSSRMPELVDFLTDFHQRQAVSGGSCSENAAWEAARAHFSGHIITRRLVRVARGTAGCLGKPGKRLNRAEK